MMAMWNLISLTLYTHVNLGDPVMIPLTSNATPIDIQAPLPCQVGLSDMPGFSASAHRIASIPWRR